jgi:uncharacterized protein
MLVGYMRVSSADDRQTVDLQRDALVAAGVDPRNLHTDKASGARDDRPGRAQHQSDRRMTGQGEATAKAIALRWIEAAVAGDTATVRSLLSPDCAVFVAGDMPFCGWMDVDAFFAQTAILSLATPITIEIGAMLAEDDRVWFEAQSYADLVGGAQYRNHYVFLLRVRDGVIVEYKEFADTLHIFRSIDDPRTRGPAITRQSFVGDVQKTLVGPAVSGDARPPDSSGARGPVAGQPRVDPRNSGLRSRRSLDSGT